MMGGFGGSMGGVTGGQGKGKRPIGVKFEIPYFTTSGIQVRYLKIIEPKVRSPRFVADELALGVRRIVADLWSQLQYPSLPWVRYITQSGDIAVRLPEVQG